MPKIKVKGQSVQTGECPQQTDTRTHTDKRTDTHTDATKRIISPATRSIKNFCTKLFCPISLFFREILIKILSFIVTAMLCYCLYCIVWCTVRPTGVCGVRWEALGTLLARVVVEQVLVGLALLARPAAFQLLQHLKYQPHQHRATQSVNSFIGLASDRIFINNQRSKC